MINKRIKELEKQIEKLEYDEMAYLEADKNKEASRIRTKRRKAEAELATLKLQKDYGSREEMMKKIINYKIYLRNKGLTKDFENFVERIKVNYDNIF